MPTPDNWSGPSNRDARIKRQTEGHIAHDGFITDKPLDNCRDLDDRLFDSGYTADKSY